MLIELAIGDAYGAGFEYASPHVVERYNDLSRYFQHPRHTLQPGAYTDDTQMSLAIAEAMVSGDPWTLEMLASRFVDALRLGDETQMVIPYHSFLVQGENVYGAGTIRFGKGPVGELEVKNVTDWSGHYYRDAEKGLRPELGFGPQVKQYLKSLLEDYYGARIHPWAFSSFMRR
jgi:hypothetical protein